MIAGVLCAAALVVGALGVAGAADIPDDCVEHWATQRLDHFRWTPTQKTFQQRYFVCDRHWSGTSGGRRGPVFFYAGNEGPLEGYLKSAGLMFENREALGALVLFVEHRYYGQTQPFGEDSWCVDPSFLTVEQAMADYSTLLVNLTTAWGARDSPVVAFGGSYGGMLAAWMRRRYPHIIVGAVAASAPVGQFPGVRGFDPSAFWEVVTRDATPAAGAAPGCDDAVRQAFAQLFAAGRTAEGRTQLSQTFKLCDPLRDEGAVTQLAYWAQGTFDAMAMGNYHFASDYMTGGGLLPAWPMRAACDIMTSLAPSSAAAVDGDRQQRAGLWQALTSSRRALRARSAPRPASTFDVNLLARLEGAAALLYNASGTASCFSLDLAGPAAGSVGAWDYQVCSEFMGQELPYFPAAATSMFWDQGAFNWSAIVEHCQSAWGTTPSQTWMVTEHGGLDWRGTSNIVFTNGGLDPWSVFGVLRDVSDSVVAVIIPDGAHHSDLMYARPDDPPSLTAARATIMQHVRRWVGDAPGPEGVAAAA